MFSFQARKTPRLDLTNLEWKINDTSIKLPFPPNSEASEYKGELYEVYHYTTTFSLTEEIQDALLEGKNNRLLIHFGAVDQTASLFINDNHVDSHFGGYLPATFDITDFITSNKEQRLILIAEDSLDKLYPYGKQTKHPKGMWYTPVSGIWKEVWLEIVPETRLSAFYITTDTKGFDLKTQVHSLLPEPQLTMLHLHIKARVYLNKNKCLVYNSRSLELRANLPIKDENPTEDGDYFELWDTENPNLYTIKIELYSKQGEEDTLLDSVETYFGLREIKIDERNDAPAIFLNGKPIFLHGILVQGYWEKGIYVPESKEEFTKDIMRAKELGFNTIRMHIKVENDAFYEECDRLGMLVMQDMVNNGSYNFLRDTAFPTLFSKQGKEKHLDNKPPQNPIQEFFMRHSRETISHLYNHPSIVYYTIFNEGWGQFNSEYVYNTLKNLDPSRIFDTASGWFKGAPSDVESDHIYFKTPNLRNRVRGLIKPLIISECGGFSLAKKGHLYNPSSTYGYGEVHDEDALCTRILRLYRTTIIPGIKSGLCGCVYTQLYDVEEEINGLYTYDREVCKAVPEIFEVISQEIQDEL